MAACPVGRVPPDMRKDGYFMKSMKRRLLSLFMAMVMVLSLAPMALAVDNNPGDSHQHTAEDNAKWESDNTKHWKICKETNCDVHVNEANHIAGEWTTVTEATCYSKGSKKTTCTTCSKEYTEEIAATGQHNFTGTATPVTSGENSGTHHSILCATTGCTATEEKEHTWGTNNKCTVCSAEKPVETVTVKTVDVSPATLSMQRGKTETITVTVTGTDEKPMSGQAVTIGSTGDSATTTTTSATTDTKGQITFTVTSDSTKTGNTTFTVTVGGKSATCAVTVSDEITITLNTSQSVNGVPKSSSSLSVAYDDSISLGITDVKVKNGTADVTKDYDISYKWTVGNSTATEETRAVFSFYADDDYTIKCAVTATPKNGITGTAKTQTATWSIKIDSDITVTATVSGNYVLSDADDKSNDSIWEKIEDRLSSGYYLDYITFENWTSKIGDLEGVSSRTAKYEEDDLSSVEFVPEEKGTAQFSFVAHVLNRDNRASTLKGILSIEVKDTSSSSSGDITYTAELGEDVYFDISDFEDYLEDKFSNASLDYVIFESASNGKVKDNRSTVDYGKDKYYVDPGKNQLDLSDVYFSPNSSKKAMTGKVSFTAYGEKSSHKRAGTITIFYLNDNASDIVYNTTAGKVTLDPKDFNEAYKQATGSKTAPSNLTIEFQNVPSNGTLTYTGGSKDKDLTKSTVKSNRYTTKSNGTYRLAQLTYTGTRGKDTIDYIAYSGGTAQFSGKVVFNGTAAAPTDVVVTYGSTGGQAVRFSQNDFVSANSAMSKATKVRFVAPANGTLLMNGASASGVDIATTLLGTVTYQPKSGFNGQDKIIFAAYDASNNTVASGTVNITVIGNPTTGTTPGGTPGGVSDVSQFKDVSATAWYRDNLATLVRKGIITGKGDGKFDPLGTVTYGEALKMVLESCGYTAALGTGSQWAINYKNLAVSRGWISSDIDLNAAISRNATAELTAKVLGVSAVTSGSPFADEANGYAAALYYTSPQIFAGSPNPNGGKPLFKNSSPLLRQEVCAVICRVSDYHTQHTTNNMPDGI